MRSNALVCFDDGGGWRALQTDALHLQLSRSWADESRSADCCRFPFCVLIRVDENRVSDLSVLWCLLFAGF